MVLDLGLPDMDGLAVLETLKARDPVQVPRVNSCTLGARSTSGETQQLEAYAEAVGAEGCQFRNPPAGGDSAIREPPE